MSEIKQASTNYRKKRTRCRNKAIVTPYSNFVLRHRRQEPGRIASQASLWDEAKQWREVLSLVNEISLSFCILMSSRLRVII